MLGLRPRASDLYLERPRLLQQLPEDPGYVVWLEAPYGYGKSVLASQWAEKLEQDNWRILWLSLAEEGFRPALAQLLGTSGDAPWTILLELLWQCPTLLVLEDLKGNEDFSTLFQSFDGLILLASRQALAYPDLPKLLTRNRLIHLQAKDLAFTLAETKTLFGENHQGQTIWNQTQGWSLPLHFAALTGKSPEGEALLEGIRLSVEDKGWQELLFLSALNYLPKESALPITNTLSRMGFLQELEEGYRLHPFIAGLLRKNQGSLKSVVSQEAVRLPLLMRGNVYESLKLFAFLVPLLEDDGSRLEINAPNTFLRWHSVASSPISVARRMHLVSALFLTHQFEQALKEIATLLEDEQTSSDHKLKVLGSAIFHLAEAKRIEEAELYKGLAETYFEQASSFRKGNYYHDLAHFYYRKGASEEARAHYEAALALYAQTPEHPNREVVEQRTFINLQGLQLENLLFELGDVSGAIKLLLHLLERPLTDYALVQINFVLTTCYMYLNDNQAAIKHLNSVLAKAEAHYLVWAKARLAYLKDRVDEFPSLLQEARQWNLATDVLQQISFLWLRTLRKGRSIENASMINDLLEPGPLVELEYVYFDYYNGNSQNALNNLVALKDALPSLEYKWHWFAAHYLLAGDQSSLNALLNASPERDRLFHYLLIPLSSLPKDQPELSKTYGLEEVLESGWQGAISYRFHEIPPLELRVLGSFEACVLHRKVNLTDRQKEILILLLLGHSREVIGEAMWPETDTKKVRNNLNVQLNFLRKLIEPWGQSTYLFEDGLARTKADLWELQEAINAGNAETISGLYRLPLAPGIDLELVNEASASLRENVIDILFEAAQSENGWGYLEKIIELDPLHEEALQQLLKQLIKKGRRRDAIKYYRTFTELLKKEIGLEPLEATSAILMQS